MAARKPSARIKPNRSNKLKHHAFSCRGAVILSGDLVPNSSILTSTLQREEEKLLACIHCGLCLEACPTYVITGDENDGPRGRLYLMRAVGEGRLKSESQSFERHIDRCLGCRACELVCPAGVEYGQLLEAARGELFQSGPKRGFSYGVLRLVLKHIWLHPARLKFAVCREPCGDPVLRKYFRGDCSSV